MPHLFFFQKGAEIMALESAFQRNIVQELKKIFPGCIVMKGDSSYTQGIPDLVILYKDKWAMLECKRNASASHRPNQDYYVNQFNDWSFASFIYPENKKQVLVKLKIFFEED